MPLWMRIQRRLRDQFGISRPRRQELVGRFFFSTLQSVTNRIRLPIYLAYRPDGEYCFDTDRTIRGLRASWIRKNAANNLGDLPRLYSLLLNVRQLLQEGVPGDFAELGVFKGNSAKVLADLIASEPRTLYLFDTFEGFDSRDLKGVDGRVGPEFGNTSLGDVREFIGEKNVQYLAGWFPDSVTAEARAARYALAHIDCDLYAPALAALEFFYPRMSPGGMILLHDYSSGHWPGIRQAVDEFITARQIPERPVLWPDKSGSAALRIMARGA